MLKSRKKIAAEKDLKKKRCQLGLTTNTHCPDHEIKMIASQNITKLNP
jgi:hypothetical protein